MRKLSRYILPALLAGFITTATQAAPTTTTAPEKEWTILVFLNGHNNLDSFGFKDVNEMEKVGSSDQVNIVVQWASLANGNTKRLYVTQDNDTSQVTSVPLEESSPVDMGDYRNLIEFVRWGTEHFPAKKYFVDVWNHGSGWHNLLNLRNRGGIGINDISNDDLTGHKITTLELGAAMEDISRMIGKKVEVYGSDACLMGMAEVAAEMSDGVRYFVGSQELEPGDGWPYDRFLAPLASNPSMDGGELGKIMVREYVDSYNNSGDLTLSVMNLEKLPEVEKAVQGLSQAIRALPKSGLKAVGRAIRETQEFFYSDYKDAGHFAAKLSGYGITQFDRRAADDLKKALDQMIVANATSPNYSKSTGVSFWIPSETYQYSAHSQEYSQLKFHKRTGWGETLKAILF
jgi:Clostripain family